MFPRAVMSRASTREWPRSLRKPCPARRSGKPHPRPWTRLVRTPKGREIHGKGITPDIIVEDANVEGDTQQPQRQSQRRLALPGDDLSDDPQLQKAIDVLKLQVKQGGKSVKAG